MWYSDPPPPPGSRPCGTCYELVKGADGVVRCGALRLTVARRLDRTNALLKRGGGICLAFAFLEVGAGCPPAAATRR